MRFFKKDINDLRNHPINKKNNKKKLLAYILLAIVIGSIFILPISAEEQPYKHVITHTGKGIIKVEITIPRKFKRDVVYTVEDMTGDGIVTSADIDAFAAKELNTFKYSIYASTSRAEAGCGEALMGIAEFCNSGVLSQIVKFDGFSWVSTISDAFLLTGRLLCFLYFLLTLMNAASSESFTLEVFIKSLAKLVILFVLFDKNTISAITSFGEALETQLLASASSAIAEKTTNANLPELLYYVYRIDDTNWLKCIGFIFENMLPSVTLLAVTVIAFIIALGRTIELLVYQTLLPIGMSSIYNGGLNSTGFRYIKKVIALYLQGVVMFLAAAIGALFAFNATNFLNREFFSSSISATVLSPVLDLVIAIVTVMIMARSKKIAEDVVGV